MPSSIAYFLFSLPPAAYAAMLLYAPYDAPCARLHRQICRLFAAVIFHAIFRDADMVDRFRHFDCHITDATFR